MISIYLFLGFHIELNILGTRDISCVLQEIQIRNTNQKLPKSITKNMKEKFSARLILQAKVRWNILLSDGKH